MPGGGRGNAVRRGGDIPDYIHGFHAHAPSAAPVVHMLCRRRRWDRQRHFLGPGEPVPDALHQGSQHWHDRRRASSLDCDRRTERRQCCHDELWNCNLPMGRWRNPTAFARSRRADPLASHVGGPLLGIHSIHPDDIVCVRSEQGGAAERNGRQRRKRRDGASAASAGFAAADMSVSSERASVGECIWAALLRNVLSPVWNDLCAAEPCAVHA